jgi:hypothetical protein
MSQFLPPFVKNIFSKCFRSQPSPTVLYRVLAIRGRNENKVRPASSAAKFVVRARFFSVQYTKNGNNVPNDLKIHQMSSLGPIFKKPGLRQSLTQSTLKCRECVYIWVLLKKPGRRQRRSHVGPKLRQCVNIEFLFIFCFFHLFKENLGRGSIRLKPVDCFFL